MRKRMSRSMPLIELIAAQVIFAMTAHAQTPVLDYRFDGDCLDSSSSANHGIVSGNATITTASNEVSAGTGALSVDGTDGSYVDLTTALEFSGSQPWSVVFWARRNQVGATTSMIMGDRSNIGSFIFLNDNFNGLRFSSTTRDLADFSAPKDTASHHYALVADGAGDLILFCDGSLVESITGDTSFKITTIGTGYSRIGYCLDGVLDEVHIYTNALASN